MMRRRRRESQPDLELDTDSRTKVTNAALLDALQHQQHLSGLWLYDSAYVSFRSSSSNDGEKKNDCLERVWEHARRRSENQTVVVSGFAGSGISTTCVNLTNELVSIAGETSTPSRGITTWLRNSWTLIQAFTTAATPLNDRASRHGGLAIVTTLNQYGGIGKMEWMVSVVDATPIHAGYAAFDVFCELLQGGATMQRQRLSIMQKEQYAYLNGRQVGRSNASEEDLWSALEDVCEPEQYHAILGFLSGVLLLGNLQFTGTDIANVEVWDKCVELCGEIPVPRSVNERDALAESIYQSVYILVIDQINAAFMTNRPPSASSNEASITICELPTAGTASPSISSFLCAYSADANLISFMENQCRKGFIDEIIADDVVPDADKQELIDIDLEAERAMCNSYQKIVTRICEGSSTQLDLGSLSLGFRISDTDVLSINHLHNLSPSVYNTSNWLLQEHIAKQVQSVIFDKTLKTSPVARTMEFVQFIEDSFAKSRVWFMACVHTASPQVSWDSRHVSRWLRTYRLPHLITSHRRYDFTADFYLNEFISRYEVVFPSNSLSLDQRDYICAVLDRRQYPIEQWKIGRERLWIGEKVWSSLEHELDEVLEENLPIASTTDLLPTRDSLTLAHMNNPYGHHDGAQTSSRELLLRSYPDLSFPQGIALPRPMSREPPRAPDLRTPSEIEKSCNLSVTGDIEANDDANPQNHQQKITKSRLLWVCLVWASTFWMPGFLLRYVGGMKRADERMAWREKFTLCLLIFFLCASVLFYIIVLGRLLCPDLEKAWNIADLSTHRGADDFYVAVRGNVYDISKFWRTQHSDSAILTSASNMEGFGGLDLTNYFPYPLTRACNGLVHDESVKLVSDPETIPDTSAMHLSGPRFQPDSTSKLFDIDWYTAFFMPKMKGYHKGQLVIAPNNLQAQSQWETPASVVSLYGKVYNFTDYFSTQKVYLRNPLYQFLDSSVEDIIQTSSGGDITEQWESSGLNASAKANHLECFQNAFLTANLDYRLSPRCRVPTILLLVFAIIICVVILTKFLAALQLGQKRKPLMQDRFVFCCVPAYTEGEDQLRKAIDSITLLRYDDKKKLLCVVCDGMITGRGNEQSTPRIVLDILGVDPKFDPEPMAYKAVADGSLQLNYAKVYSGLYEFEGHVIPYLVIVKVGQSSESYKPGNRGNNLIYDSKLKF